MTASSEHVTDYIFPSVPISQLTEEKKENDCIFIFFKDLFFDYVSACAHDYWYPQRPEEDHQTSGRPQHVVCLQ